MDLMVDDLEIRAVTYVEDFVGPGDETCLWLDDRPCWCDGSAVRAERVLTEWLARDRDMEWLFAFLAGYYHDVFRSDGQNAPLELMEMMAAIIGAGDEEES